MGHLVIHSDYDADKIARSLKGRKSGNVSVALCPAHQDANPSLSIRCVNGKRAQGVSV